VESQQQCEREICRLIILGRDRTEVLLTSAESGLALPVVEIPRWERLAENLTGSLRTDWGCDAICLFTPNCSSEDRDSNGKHYVVMECWCDEGQSGETVWKPIGSLTAGSFRQAAEFRVFEQSLQELDIYQRDPSSPFTRKGWLAELRGWTAEVIRPLGLELTGSFCQYNGSPCFSLIRFETNGPAVWFKATGKPNRREFPITLKLAERFPRFIPKILGTKPEWNGWLSGGEVDRTNPGKTKDATSWEQTATELARLQIESIAESQSILRCGAHDLRAKRLFTAVDPFFDRVARLMEQQPKVPPAILNRDELSLLKLRVEDVLTLFQDLRIPVTLGHLDLNPGNVIVSAERCVFLDWAEAYVGNPFFSLEYLVQHFRRQIDTSVASESQLTLAYKAQWGQLLEQDEIDEATTLAKLTALFAYAVGTDTWKDEGKLKDPTAVGYLRSLARRMNNEAIKLTERRSPCLS